MPQHKSHPRVQIRTAQPKTALFQLFQYYLASLGPRPYIFYKYVDFFSFIKQDSLGVFCQISLDLAAHSALIKHIKGTNNS